MLSYLSQTPPPPIDEITLTLSDDILNLLAHLIMVIIFHGACLIITLMLVFIFPFSRY